MAGELAAEWIRIPDGNGNLQKVWLRDSTARRDIAQMQTDIPTQIANAINAEAGLLIPYGYCTTAAATVAKTVTVSPTVTSLETGLTIAVKFKYANTESNPTLNVNNLGAVAIKRYGTTAAGTSAASNWNANSVVMLIYDGTYWMLTDFNNTTYSGMTDAEYQAGTGTSNRLITPARLKAAILYHVPVDSVNGQTGAVTVNVPTKTSDLTNDSGFITSAPVTSVNGQTGAVVLTASDVGAMPSGTTIPTKTSDLTNDSGFITSAAVPTKTSDLTNDSGYITGYTETDPTVPSWAKASSKPTYTAAEVGALPSSTVIPSKTSDLTNDSGFITGYTETDPTVPAWAKAANKPSYTAAEVGALPDTTPIPAVPTNVSAFTNDAGYLTSYTETDPTVPSWAKASTKPSYTAAEVGALPSSTVIPSKTSDLTNDSGFITGSKFAVLTGTIGAETGFSSILSYPSGFTFANCMVLSLMINYSSTWRHVGDGTFSASSRIFTRLTEAGVSVYNAVSQAYSLPYKVALMRTDI